MFHIRVSQATKSGGYAQSGPQAAQTCLDPAENSVSGCFIPSLQIATLGHV